MFPPCGAAGCGTGIGVDFFVGADFCCTSSSTVVARPALFDAKTDSESDVTMNSTAEIVVARESKVAEPRGPKAVCDPIPPNAPAKSAAFPLCSNTTTIKKRQTTT